MCSVCWMIFSATFVFETTKCVDSLAQMHEYSFLFVQYMQFPIVYCIPECLFLFSSQFPYVTLMIRNWTLSTIGAESLSLELTKIVIPTFKLHSEPALLECHYQLNASKNNKKDYSGYRSMHANVNDNNGLDDLYGNGRRSGSNSHDGSDEEETLYSVKWYKDNEEFYRYVPRANPPQRIYNNVEGVRVDVSIETHFTIHVETDRIAQWSLAERHSRKDLKKYMKKTSIRFISSTVFSLSLFSFIPLLPLLNRLKLHLLSLLSPLPYLKKTHFKTFVNFLAVRWEWIQSWRDYRHFITIIHFRFFVTFNVALKPLVGQLWEDQLWKFRIATNSRFLDARGSR